MIVESEKRKGIKEILRRGFIVLPLLFVFVQSREVLDAQITPRVIAFGGYLFAAGVAMFFAKSAILDFRRSAPILLPLALFLLWSAAGLLYTINVPDGAASVLMTGLLLGGVIVVITLGNDGRITRGSFAVTLTLTALVLSLTGFHEISRVYIAEGFTHQAMYDVQATMGHKNIFSEYLLLLLPFTVYTAVQYDKLRRAVGIFSAGFIVSICTVSMTRSVWAAGFAALALTIAVLVFASKNRPFSLKKYGLPLVLFTGVGLLAFAVYAAVDEDSLIVKQFFSAFHFTHGSVKDRLVMWQKSLQLAGETPLAGAGPGSWKILFLQTGNEGLLSSNNLVYYQRPHNDFIWVLNEHGAVGLLLFSAAFIVSLVLCFKNILRSADNEELFFRAAVFFALSAYIGISQFSFPKERPAFIILLSFLWGMVLLGRSRKIRGVSAVRYRRILPAVLVVAIGAAGIWIGSERYGGEKHMKRAFGHRSAGNPRGVINNVERAESSLYKFDSFSTPVQWYAATALYELGQREEACKRYEYCLKLNPLHIYILNDLGTCRGTAGRVDEAFELYRRSLRTAPNFEQTLYNIAALHYQENSIDSAVYYFQKIREPENAGRYNQFINALIKPLFDHWLEIVEEPELRRKIEIIRNDREWTTALLAQSERTGKLFKINIIHNALYDLRQNDKLSDTDYADLLKKYK